MKAKRIMALVLTLAMLAAVCITLAACGGTSSKVLTEIKVNLPNTVYEEGEKLNTEGMTVTATYEDGAEKEVTGWKILIGRNEMASDYQLKKTDTRITVEYTEGEVTKTRNVTITVNGAWTLTVKNAKINGSYELPIRKDGKLPADAEIVMDNGADNLGWQDEEGNYYGTYAELAAVFSMPGRDSEILAVTSDSFTQPFTPSCSYKHLESYSEPDDNGVRTIKYDNTTQVNGAFEHVQTDGGNWATRYIINTTQDIGILNGVDEGHKNNADYPELYNNCPYSDTVEKIILMNFTNNSNEAITIMYGVECFGIRGEVTVELGAGETKSAYLKQLYAPAGKTGNVAFHVLCVLDGGNSGYDITIYGFLAQ